MEEENVKTANKKEKKSLTPTTTVLITITATLGIIVLTGIVINLFK